MIVQNSIQDNCVNKADALCEGLAHGRSSVLPGHHQTVIKLPGDSLKFRVGTLNVGTLRGRAGEVVETISRRNVDICCLQEVRWRGASARMIQGKDTQYKLFWVGSKDGTGGVGILVADRWIEKVIDVNRVNDRIMLVKLLLGKVTVVIVSVYAPQQGLPDGEKDRFYEELLLTLSAIGSNEIIMLCGDLNGHVGRAISGYANVHGGYGFGVRNAEGERILELGDAMNMMVCNTFYQKRDSRLITYNSGGNQSQIDYIMIKRSDRNLVTDVKVIPGEECATQHQLLVADMNISKPKEAKKKFTPKRKVWRLKEEETRLSFLTELQSCIAYNPESTIEEKWDSLEKALLQAVDKSCGWTKKPPRHKVTWWWNAEVEVAIKEKRRLWKAWKDGGNKNDYLEAKRNSKKKVYEAKKKAEEERFADVTHNKDARNQLFTIVRQLAKTNCDVIGEKCVTNDDGELACTDSEKLSAWKQHYVKLLNEEFPWEEEHLVYSEPCQGPHPRIDREWVKEAIHKMKDGKAAGTSGVVAEMLKAAGDTGIDLMTDLCNTIVAEKTIPTKWDTSIILNCFKGKGAALERGNYRGLKLIEHAMKVFERVIEKLLRETVTISSMQFGFMPGKGTTDAIFLVRQVQERFMSKKKPLYFAFVYLQKAFDRVPSAVLEWSLRELVVDDWLIKVIMAMYKNAKSLVSVNGVLGD